MVELMTIPTLDLLLKRRSVKPDKLTAPGPTPDELTQILTIAARVPDHKKLAPWRFIVFQGDARADMGEVFAQACRREEKEPPSEVRLATERSRFTRAPLVIGVISRVIPTRGAPEWEQVLSAGACCYNLCLAANALGYGTNWITEWVGYSPYVRSALQLGENERIAGFIYIGTASEKPDERDRPRLEDVVQYWNCK